MNIAVVAEMAPAKTLIPVIEKLDSKVLSLTHGEGVEKLLEPYSYEVIPIGHGRRNSTQKRSNFTIGGLVLKDTFHAYTALRNKDLDLVLTCGNAGDVRKGISAAKQLKIPKIHMEQDIYNPIEMIAYADLITVPNSHAKKALRKMYDLTNTVNIKGYPQAEYVSRVQIVEPEAIYKHYGFNDFYVLFLGGDTRSMDIPYIIKEIQKLDKTILIVPYRFEAKSIAKFVTRKGVYIIDGYVDLISLMNASQGVIYCAGMGVTIELGALSVPAVKILGFHTEHASNELAQSIGIDVISVYDIGYAVSHMRKPHGSRLVKNGIKASNKVAELTMHMDMFDQTVGGRKSLKLIWNQRKKYR